MLDLKDWDKIKFEDITEGMTVLMVRMDDHRTFTYEGVAESWRGEHGWWEMSGNWFASPEPVVNMTTHFYTKPFEFPTKPLTIIEGTYKYTSGSNNRSRFILTEDGGWFGLRDGGRALLGPLRSNFKDWKVISNGIDA